MLIYKNRKQKILRSGLHLQNNFNRRFSTQFKIIAVITQTNTLRY